MSTKRGPRVTIHCLWCGKAVQVMPCHASRQFCCQSHAKYYMHAQSGHGSHILTCPICGSTLTIKNSQTGIIHTCGSKACRSAQMRANFKHALEQRIGTSLGSELHRLYIDERLSYRKICNRWQINVRTLMKLMREFDIEPRDRSEAIATQWENNPKRKAAQAKLTSKRMRAYYANGVSAISKRPDVRRKISDAKKRNNWMRGRTGPRHHLWQGGKIWWRGKDWNDLKEQIRQRDDYHCCQCHISDQECIELYGAPLQVHHIVPYRLSHDNSPTNLKTLCNHCHGCAEYDFQWVL